MEAIIERVSECSVWREYILIFVTVGSREYQFDRLIKEIDNIVQNSDLSDVFFVQLGASNYIPKSVKYEKFLNKKEFEYYQSKADIIVSHGGTGALVSALKRSKQVIAVPRFEKYGEHIDNHQLQVTSALATGGYLIEVKEISQLLNAILQLKNNPIQKKYEKEPVIPLILDEFIKGEKN